MKDFTFEIQGLSKPTQIKIYLKLIGLSSQLIKNLSKNLGQIKVNEKDAIMTNQIFNGDILKLELIENETNQIIPIKKDLQIAYEDDYLLIIYKDKYTSTIPSYCNFKSSLANYVVDYMINKQKNFIYRALNRLDKNAEGYIIIPKDKLTYSLLLNNKSICKLYTAKVHGKVHKQIIEKNIATLKKDNGFNQIQRKINGLGKYAKTEIIESNYNKKLDYSIIKIYLHTGRTHQIRLHLSSIGHPLYGDKLYNENFTLDDLQLYCNELYFFHPYLHKSIHLLHKLTNLE